MKALYHHGRKGLPYGTDLNIYSGCSHGCIYCYARANYAARRDVPYTDFQISLLRHGIVKALDMELYNLNREVKEMPVINIGGSCDSYQPPEAINTAMRDILAILIKYKVPAVLSTKSVFIIRDLDLIDSLASTAHVNVSITITSENHSVSHKIEPGASPPADRIAALKELSRTRAFTGLHYFPVIPFIGDRRETVEASAGTDAASDSGCSYIMPGFLYLRGNIRPMFMDGIRVQFPHLADRFQELYKKGSADQHYKSNFYKMFYSITGRKNLCTDYRKFLPASCVNSPDKLS